MRSILLLSAIATSSALSWGTWDSPFSSQNEHYCFAICGSFFPILLGKGQLNSMGFLKNTWQERLSNPPCSSPPSPRLPFFFLDSDQKQEPIFGGCRSTSAIEEKSSEGDDEEEDEGDNRKKRREEETRKPKRE